MHTQAAVFVSLRRIVLAEFLWHKALYVVVFGIGSHRCGIKRDERRIDEPKFAQLQNLFLHDLFEYPVIQFADEAVKCPVGRQRPTDIETAVVCNEQIVAQIVVQIGDLAESFTFHDNEST